MGRVLMLVSSARSMRMADGKPHVTGYFAEEALKPYDRLTAAGVEVVVATPDGEPPVPDPYGLEAMFHYPDEDEDFLASITRSFMQDVDDIRITLQHLTELDLIAARRVYEELVASGLPAREARPLVERAARAAWAGARSFIEVLAADAEVTGRVTPGRLRELSDEVQAASAAESKRVAERLASLPGFQKPLRVRDLGDKELAGFDAVFIPGGHGPMVNMAENADVGRVLRHFHEREKTIAALCHGPAALLSAGETPDGKWLFDGYKLTSFADEEEDQTRPGKKGMPWYLEAALKNAGGVFDDAPSPWASHVVVDRNLITAQNPMSSEAAADALLKRLRSAGKVRAA